MFLEKQEGKPSKLTLLSKSIVSACTLIAALAGGLFFMEDRYFNTADAREMIVIMEASAVKTFQMQQKILQTEQKGLERKWDMDRLRDLRDHKILLQKELGRDPRNELIKERLEIIQQKIEKLENKLYN